MNLSELIDRFRSLANDKVEPYFWSDEVVTQFLNDAEIEAVVRGRLIHESDHAGLCEIKTTAGKATYQLKPQMYEITHACWDEDVTLRHSLLGLSSTEALDQSDRHWRTRPASTPHSIIQSDRTIRLVPPPEKSGVLVIEAYRLPRNQMELSDDEPEINPAHHRHLIHWALHMAFSIPDTESFDPNRSEQAANAFEKHFGLPVDSDMRRITRHDVQHHVEAFWV